MIPLGVKAFGDCDGRWGEPAINAHGEVDLDPAETLVGSMTAKGLTVTVGSGPNKREVLSLDDQQIEVKVTTARVVYRCVKYDTGGGWVGLGVAGLATAAVANTVSKRQAAKRSANTGLTGHRRFPWIAAAGGSAKQGWLDSDALLLRGSTTEGAENELITLQFDLPAGSDTGAIAADIMRRAAAYRLEHESLDAEEVAALTELTLAQPLRGSGRSVPMLAPPSFYPVGAGERVFWPDLGQQALSQAPTPTPEPEPPTEPATELLAQPSAPNHGLPIGPSPTKAAAARPAPATEPPTPPGGDGPTSEPPIDWPHYGISFGAAIKRGFTKYATFSGRASRSEYWWWSLFAVLVYFALAVLFRLSGNEEASNPIIWLVIIYWLVFALPTLALTVRRLHDTGRSGWMWFIGFIPLVGGWILLAFLAGGTSLTASRFGPPGGTWASTPPSGAARRSSTDHRKAPNRAPVVVVVAALAVLVIIGAGVLIRNASNLVTAENIQGGYEGESNSGMTGDREVDNPDPTSEPTEAYEPPTAPESSDEPSDAYSPEPVAPPTRANGQVSMGSRVQLGHFTVQVTELVAEPGKGMLVSAEACVTQPIKEPGSDLTMVTWNPWKLVVGGREIRPRLADPDFPPASMFPKEGLHEVGECVMGNIPFADVDAESPIEAVEYLNGVGEKAVWTVADTTTQNGTPQGEIQTGCGPSEDEIRTLRDHPEIVLKQATCSTVDPGWAVVTVDYRRQDDPPVWAAADMYFSKIDGEWVQAHDDIGAHAHGWCQAYKTPGFPSDFRNRLKSTCG